MGQSSATSRAFPPRPHIKHPVVHSSVPTGKSKPLLSGALVRALMLPAEGIWRSPEVCPCAAPPQASEEGLPCHGQRQPPSPRIRKTSNASNDHRWTTRPGSRGSKAHRALVPALRWTLALAVSGVVPAGSIQC